ncbi:hypothetical protein Pmani_030269 [Petrolisthes manimaculis]|uniref:Uncharacterized protein n=1 Tax=Petrolisthes manimaculis TaxID=1843537 RepID=A0AAE1NXV2_9EUCA|nr:hypothetical protein Pmani_030269 [Petrolisthes manimaculis]
MRKVVAVLSATVLLLLPVCWAGAEDELPADAVLQAVTLLQTASGSRASFVRNNIDANQDETPESSNTSPSREGENEGRIRNDLLQATFQPQKIKTPSKKVRSSLQRVNTSQLTPSTSQQRVRTSEQKQNISRQRLRTLQKRLNAPPPSVVPQSEVQVVRGRVDASSNSVPVENLVGTDTSGNRGGSSSSRGNTRVKSKSEGNNEVVSTTFKKGRRGRARVVTVRRPLSNTATQTLSNTQAPEAEGRIGGDIELEDVNLKNIHSLGGWGKRLSAARSNSHSLKPLDDTTQRRDDDHELLAATTFRPKITHRRKSPTSSTSDTVSQRIPGRVTPSTRRGSNTRRRFQTPRPGGVNSDNRESTNKLQVTRPRVTRPTRPLPPVRSGNSPSTRPTHKNVASGQSGGTSIKPSAIKDGPPHVIEDIPRIPQDLPNEEATQNSESTNPQHPKLTPNHNSTPKPTQFPTNPPVTSNFLVPRPTTIFPFSSPGAITTFSPNGPIFQSTTPSPFITGVSNFPTQSPFTTFGHPSGSSFVSFSLNHVPVFQSSRVPSSPTHSPLTPASLFLTTAQPPVTTPSSSGFGSSALSTPRPPLLTSPVPALFSPSGIPQFLPSQSPQVTSPRPPASITSPSPFLSSTIGSVPLLPPNFNSISSPSPFAFTSPRPLLTSSRPNSFSSSRQQSFPSFSQPQSFVTPQSQSFPAPRPQSITSNQSPIFLSSFPTSATPHPSSITSPQSTAFKQNPSPNPTSFISTFHPFSSTTQRPIQFSPSTVTPLPPGFVNRSPGAIVEIPTTPQPPHISSFSQPFVHTNNQRTPFRGSSTFRSSQNQAFQGNAINNRFVNSPFERVRPLPSQSHNFPTLRPIQVNSRPTLPPIHAAPPPSQLESPTFIVGPQDPSPTSPSFSPTPTPSRFTLLPEKFDFGSRLPPSSTPVNILPPDFENSQVVSRSTVRPPFSNSNINQVSHKRDPPPLPPPPPPHSQRFDSSPTTATPPLPLQGTDDPFSFLKMQHELNTNALRNRGSTQTGVNPTRAPFFSVFSTTRPPRAPNHPVNFLVQKTKPGVSGKSQSTASFQRFDVPVPQVTSRPLGQPPSVINQANFHNSNILPGSTHSLTSPQTSAKSQRIQTHRNSFNRRPGSNTIIHPSKPQNTNIAPSQISSTLSPFFAAFGQPAFTRFGENTNHSPQANIHDRGNTHTDSPGLLRGSSLSRSPILGTIQTQTRGGHTGSSNNRPNRIQTNAPHNRSGNLSSRERGGRSTTIAPNTNTRTLQTNTQSAGNRANDQRNQSNRGKVRFADKLRDTELGDATFPTQQGSVTQGGTQNTGSSQSQTRNQGRGGRDQQLPSPPVIHFGGFVPMKSPTPNPSLVLTPPASPGPKRNSNPQEQLTPPPQRQAISPERLNRKLQTSNTHSGTNNNNAPFIFSTTTIPPSVTTFRGTFSFPSSQATHPPRSSNNIHTQNEPLVTVAPNTFLNLGTIRTPSTARSIIARSTTPGTVRPSFNQPLKPTLPPSLRLNQPVTPRPHITHTVIPTLPPPPSLLNIAQPSTLQPQFIKQSVTPKSRSALPILLESKQLIQPSNSASSSPQRRPTAQDPQSTKPRGPTVGGGTDIGGDSRAFQLTAPLTGKSFIFFRNGVNEYRVVWD